MLKFTLLYVEIYYCFMLKFIIVYLLLEILKMNILKNLLDIYLDI